ncbi:triple tyrosine motif-containing protein [Flavobacterium sp. LB2P74]|uniref:helix-turn-helix and ligand-binding sensor domain-containing protein n=1 Tax=Flavobacterium sp. LB2P74 TaxID=3401717 RepID=UPI003AAAAF40
MRFIKFIILFVLISVSQTPLIGQVKNIGIPEIKNYPKSDYKGGTQNWDIDQDKNGNLFFANNNGLFQFDGSTWTKHALPNFSGLKSLKIDNSGKIFVGGYNEFGYFETNPKGKLNYFSISKLLHAEAKNTIDFIWKIHLYKDEVIFQSFGGAYVFKNNKLEFLEAPDKFQFSFRVKDQLYFQDIAQGLLAYRDGQFIPLKGTTSLNKTEIWGMFTLPNNRILITTLNKGLFIYDGEKISSWETEANDFIKKNSSLGGVQMNETTIVLNSVSNGMIVCDTNGKIIQTINRAKGLYNNTVLSSFIDHKNNIWLGLDNGITFINENSPFTYFGFSYDLSTVYASVIYKKNLYVATNQGVYYHPWNGSVKNNKFIPVTGTTGQAWNLQIIDGQLLCAHNNGAIVIAGGKAVKKLDTNGYFGFKQLRGNPNYFIGAKYDGFSIFEKTNTGLQFRNHIQGFNQSAASFEIEDDHIWLKKDASLYKLKLAENLEKIISTRKYENLTSSNKGIGSIQHLNNDVYFQTDNHFFRYSQKQDLFFEDKKISALFQNIPKISATNEDALGNIWYVFNESLGVLMKIKNGNYKKLQAPFSNFSGNLVNNHLSINTVNPNTIFIGLTEGLAHYDSQFGSAINKKPTAFIKTYSFPKDTLILGNATQTELKLKIPYASNHIKFTFSSPIYENMENVAFTYLLEGFDDRWSDWSASAVKEYTNLKEGNYKMKVKVRNSFGLESEEAFVSFTIAPPWYRHFLAYLLYILIITASIFFIRNRIKVKIRKNKYYETIEQRRLYLEKESKIRQEQYELEKEIEKLKNDKLQIKILTKDKELVNNSLQVVKKNKILNGIIYKLKDINVESFDDATKFQFSKLNKSITKEVNADKSWKDLEKHIKNVHFDFLKRLKEKHPTISPRELDLSTYLLMNMSTKEIAEIMNISSGGAELARYRLRKKLELNKKENLTGFLMSI